MHTSNTPMDVCSFRAQVVALLETHGWTAVGGTAIAAKEIDTTVGFKTAHVHLADCGRASEYFSLTGDYVSEGRNVLEPWFALLPKGADRAQLQGLVDRFARRAEKAINESYAVKLLPWRAPACGARTS